MKQNNNGNGEMVEAIKDLTRVIIAMSGEFTSKAEIIRKLQMLMPPNRIGELLGMKTKDVTSAILKAKKASKQSKK